MSTIDVLIAVDAESIVSKYGKNNDPNNPTFIPYGSQLIFMITKRDNVLSGQGGSELKIQANTLDTIRWRQTTLSLNAENDAILYQFVPSRGGNLIAPPRPEIATVKTALPDPNDPTSPNFQTIQNYFWNTTAEKPGNVTYSFRFAIVDRHDNILGYYSWDPFIEISD